MLEEKHIWIPACTHPITRTHPIIARTHPITHIHLIAHLSPQSPFLIPLQPPALFPSSSFTCVSQILPPADSLPGCLTFPPSSLPLPLAANPCCHSQQGSCPWPGESGSCFQTPQSRAATLVSGFLNSPDNKGLVKEGSLRRSSRYSPEGKKMLILLPPPVSPIVLLVKNMPPPKGRDAFQDNLRMFGNPILSPFLFLFHVAF